MKKDKTKDIVDYVNSLKELKTERNLPSELQNKTAVLGEAQKEPIDKKMKIGIVGVGSIGQTIAVLLKDKGFDVEITKKSKNSLVIDNMVNLEINGAFGDHSILIPYVEDNKFTSKKDVIIMCTQSFSTVGALQEVKKYLKANGVVVSIQNVLNIFEVLEIIPPERYVAMVIDWTASRIEENHVVVLRNGDMHIGVFDEKAEAHLPKIKSMLDAVANTVIKTNMMSFIASRFVLSSTLSCVLAITGHNLKKSLTNKTTRKLIVGTIAEMLEVFEAYDIKVFPYCNCLDYYKFVKRGLKGWIYRNIIFNRLMNKNGDLTSSQLRALENKKRTELDSMCASIVNMAKAKNIDVPFNETISNFLYDVEEGKETIFMENLNKPCFTNLKIKWSKK